VDNGVSPTGLVVGQPDSILLWHWCLGHPSLHKFRSVISIEFSSLHLVVRLVRWSSIIVSLFRVESITVVVLHLS